MHGEQASWEGILDVGHFVATWTLFTEESGPGILTGADPAEVRSGKRRTRGASFMAKEDVLGK